MKVTCKQKEVAIKKINSSDVEIEFLVLVPFVTNLIADDLVKEFLSDKATVKFLYAQHSDDIISKLTIQDKKDLIKKLQESIKK